MSNALRKLSEEEKAKRRQILEDLEQWKKVTGSSSLVRYAQEKGLAYPYLSIVAKWNRSLARNSRKKSDASGPSFTKIARPAPDTRISDAVKITVAGVSIEVGEHSSRAALATALSVLGVSNVSGL